MFWKNHLQAMPTKSLSISDHVFQTSRCVVHVLAWVLEIIAEKHQLHQVNLPCHPDKWKSWELGHHCQSSWGMATCLLSLLFRNLLSKSTETEVTASLSRALMTQATIKSQMFCKQVQRKPRTLVALRCCKISCSSEKLSQDLRNQCKAYIIMFLFPQPDSWMFTTKVTCKLHSINS